MVFYLNGGELFSSLKEAEKNARESGCYCIIKVNYDGKEYKVEDIIVVGEWNSLQKLNLDKKVEEVKSKIKTNKRRYSNDK